MAGPRSEILWAEWRPWSRSPLDTATARCSGLPSLRRSWPSPIPQPSPGSDSSIRIPRLLQLPSRHGLGMCGCAHHVCLWLARPDELIHLNLVSHVTVVKRLQSGLVSGQCWLKYFPSFSCRWCSDSKGHVHESVQSGSLTRELKVCSHLLVKCTMILLEWCSWLYFGIHIWSILTYILVNDFRLVGIISSAKLLTTFSFLADHNSGIWGFEFLVWKLHSYMVHALDRRILSSDKRAYHCCEIIEWQVWGIQKTMPRVIAFVDFFYLYWILIYMAYFASKYPVWTSSREL
jgi:hypothetical protein